MTLGLCGVELLGTAFNMMFVDYFLLSICDCCAHILNLIVKAGLYAIDMVLRQFVIVSLFGLQRQRELKILERLHVN